MKRPRRLAPAPAAPPAITPRKLTPAERELVRLAARIFLRKWEAEQEREREAAARVGSAA